MNFSELKYRSSLTRFQMACRENLGKNRDFTIEALKAVWDKQTEYEKKIGQTIQKNWVGFDAVSAKKLSSIAKKIESNNELNDDEIKKMAIELKKYIEQLFLIVHKKI